MKSMILGYGSTGKSIENYLLRQNISSYTIWMIMLQIYHQIRVRVI